MTKRRRVDHRLSGPAQLLQAVPYLLGFHPTDSLVLVGLRESMLAVTARLDLADAADEGLLTATLEQLGGGGAERIVAVVYCDSADTGGDYTELAGRVTRSVATAALELIDLLHVRMGRWTSLACRDTACCPDGGSELPREATSFVAAATLDGRAPLPDRDALAAVLEPLPATRRDALRPALTAYGSPVPEVAALAAASKRSLFATARASEQARWSAPDDAAVVACALALGEPATRDSLWMALDSRRLDGRPLWCDLARRLPSPWDAPALFLFGWRSWRAGDGAMARIAVDRTLASDPDYHAADLLSAALAHGLDPRTFPTLRRSA